MKFSIIVPVVRVTQKLRQCIDQCLKLDYPDFEIIVLSNSKEKLNCPKTKIVSTGSVPPSYKRDIGSKCATGSVLAFIDDDAYPSRGWLKEAAKHFENENVAAVGGPAVTPDEDNIKQKAGGYVLSSLLGGGAYRYRYLPQEGRKVDDYPTCNLLVRKSVFDELGGFNTRFWPGEDTKLCLEITKKLGKRIVYDPRVLIYHHRRELFKPHLKQVWNYGVHRGYYVKEFPETSFRLSYFLPSFFVIALGSGFILSFIYPPSRILYASAIAMYFLVSLLTGIGSTKNIKMAVLVSVGIIFTHIVYGVGFVKGLLSKELDQ